MPSTTTLMATVTKLQEGYVGTVMCFTESSILVLQGHTLIELLLLVSKSLGSSALRSDELGAGFSFAKKELFQWVRVR